MSWLYWFLKFEYLYEIRESRIKQIFLRQMNRNFDSLEIFESLT